VIVVVNDTVSAFSLFSLTKIQSTVDSFKTFIVFMKQLSEIRTTPPPTRLFTYLTLWLCYNICCSCCNQQLHSTNNIHIPICEAAFLSSHRYHRHHHRHTTTAAGRHGKRQLEEQRIDSQSYKTNVCLHQSKNQRQRENKNHAHQNTENKQSESHDKYLMTRIINCPYGFKLNQIIRDSSSQIFSSVELSQALLHRIQAFDQSESLKPADISGLLNCLSKQKIRNNDTKKIHREAMGALSSSSLSNIHRFNARQISMTANSLARLHLVDPTIFDLMANRAVSIINTFNSQGLANTINAYAKMRHVHPDLFRSTAKASIQIMHTFNSQELANVANAYAKMNYPHGNLFENIAHEAIPIINTFNAQELSNLVTAFAKLHHQHPPLFNAVSHAATDKIQTFNSQNMANTLRAYAKVNHPAPTLFQTIADSALPILASGSFNAQELAMSANAFSKTGLRHVEFMQGISRAAVPIITTFSPHGLVILIDAFANCQCIQQQRQEEEQQDYTKLFSSVSTAILPLLPTLGPHSLIQLADAYSQSPPPPTTTTTTATPPEQLYRGIAARSIRILDTFPPSSRTTLLQAIRRSGSKADGEVTERLFRAVVRGLLEEENGVLGGLDVGRKGKWDDGSLVSLADLVTTSVTCRRVVGMEEGCLKVIGRAILKRVEEGEWGVEMELDGRYVGMLAKCFSQTVVPSSEGVLEVVCRTWRNLEKDSVGLETVGNVAGAVWLIQRLDLEGGEEMVKEVVELAIEKVEGDVEERPQPRDVRDVIVGLERAVLPGELWEGLLLAYRPFLALGRGGEEDGELEDEILAIYSKAGIGLDMVEDNTLFSDSCP